MVNAKIDNPVLAVEPKPFPKMIWQSDTGWIVYMTTPRTGLHLFGEFRGEWVADYNMDDKSLDFEGSITLQNA